MDPTKPTVRSERCLLNITGRAPVPAIYPMRKVITPVPVEGGVAGGALPIQAISTSNLRTSQMIRHAKSAPRQLGRFLSRA